MPAVPYLRCFTTHLARAEQVDEAATAGTERKSMYARATTADSALKAVLEAARGSGQAPAMIQMLHNAASSFCSTAHRRKLVVAP